MLMRTRTVKRTDKGGAERSAMMDRPPGDSGHLSRSRSRPEAETSKPSRQSERDILRGRHRPAAVPAAFRRSTPMKIGILGSGNVAQALARGFLRHDHQVMMGTRDQAKLSGWAAE